MSHRKLICKTNIQLYIKINNKSLFLQYIVALIKKNLLNKIYQKIREYSKEKGETMKEIATAYGVTPQSIQLYFSGKNAMPLNFLAWYIETHPDLDLYALFDKKQQNIVAEPKPTYQKKVNKQDVIDKIVAILEKEL